MIHPPRVAFLIPGEQSGPCGVTDYTMWIAAAAAEYGAQVLVLSIYRFPAREFITRAPESARPRLTLRPPSSPRPSPAQLASALREFAPDFVVFQFSPPAFRTGRWVYPYLAKICRELQPFNVLLMMHETWLRPGEPASLRNVIVGALRRIEILSSLRRLRASRVYASNPLYLSTLTRAGLAPHALPLFSNIPGGPRPPRSPFALPALLNELDLAPSALSSLPENPAFALFFARISSDWDPAPLLAQLQRETIKNDRNLVLISVGETGYSDRGWQRVLSAAHSIPCIRLGTRPASIITRLLHAVDYGISPTPLPYWLKSSACAAMVACELPVVFSEPSLPDDGALPPVFATLGEAHLEWHHPAPDRASTPSTPAAVWQLLLLDAKALFTGSDFSTPRISSPCDPSNGSARSSRLSAHLHSNGIEDGVAVSSAMIRQAPVLAFNAGAFFEGSAGVRRFAFSAAEALTHGPLAPRVRLFAPSCRRSQFPTRFLPCTTFFKAPDPRRGTAFNNLFWANLLALHLRLHHPGAIFYSPLEVYALVPFSHPILTVHDCYADRFGDPRRPGGRPNIGRRLRLRQMRRSQLLSVSQFTTRELTELHGLTPPRVATVPNWLPRNFDAHPTSARLEALRIRLKLPDRFWLYVGGFRLNKNLPFLIEAYAAARSQRLLPPLVIAGQMPVVDDSFTGPILATLTARPSLNSSIIRTGFVPEEDLSALYKLSALAVCPSFYEGFGYPVIEAAATEVPILAAHAASFPELVDNAACLFSPRKPDELISRFLTAADNEHQFLTPLRPDYLPVNGEARFNAAIAAHSQTHRAVRRPIHRT